MISASNSEEHYRFFRAFFLASYERRAISKTYVLSDWALRREVYYRHLAHLSDRLGSLEVAISLIRKINYRPDSGSRLLWTLV